MSRSNDDDDAFEGLELSGDDLSIIPMEPRPVRQMRQRAAFVFCVHEFILLGFLLKIWKVMMIFMKTASLKR